ncbi:hypothetical protein CH063_10134, partial [Colletotrichum higginsianum]
MHVSTCLGISPPPSLLLPLPPCPPPREGRLPRTWVIRTGCEVTAARAMATRTSWPPPSPVRPSISMDLRDICG